MVVLLGVMQQDDQEVLGVMEACMVESTTVVVEDGDQEEEEEGEGEEMVELLGERVSVVL